MRICVRGSGFLDRSLPVAPSYKLSLGERAPQPGIINKSSSLRKEILITPSPPKPSPSHRTSYLKAHGYNLLLITVVAWVANYYHFMNFGLYDDDWFFVANPFLSPAKYWLTTSLSEQFEPQFFQGRPLQIIFEYGFAEIGALFQSIPVDYLIAFVLFSGSALMLYELLRRRFSQLVATLTSLIFVLSPLYTLHQFLNGQFTFGPAFALLFAGMILYERGKRGQAYTFAVLSLMTYESIFLLFLAAPLFIQGRPVLKGRGREWIRHLAICLVIVGVCWASRLWLGEKRVNSVGQGVLWSVLRSTVYYAVTWPGTYLYAFVKANEATVEAWFFAILFCLTLPVLLRRARNDKSAASPAKWPDFGSAVFTAIFLTFCGCLTSYYFFFRAEPIFVVAGRDTRINVAATVGSSLLIAILLAWWIEISRAAYARVIAYLGTVAALTVLFLYTFVVQNDYVREWDDERSDIAQIILLTPDIEPDSIIIMKHHFYPVSLRNGGFRRRAIGFEKTLYEPYFEHLFGVSPAPKMFYCYSDAWPKFLKLDPDGYFSWTADKFDGRWFPYPGGRRRPGRFIVMDEVEPGHIVRHTEPTYVDGQQIVQMPGPLKHRPLWITVPDTPFNHQFIPWFAIEQMKTLQPAAN